MNTEHDLNPFQAPKSQNTEAPPRLVNDDAPPSPVIVFFRWLVICAISGAPSFFLATMILKENAVESIAGMVAGLLVFVIGFSIIELRPGTQQALQDRQKLLALKIGIGIRIGMSVLFPVGFVVDMLIGFLTVAITTDVIGGVEERGNFFWYFGTTLLHGFFLNAVLGTIILFIYAIIIVVSPMPIHDEEQTPRK